MDMYCTQARVLNCPRVKRVLLSSYLLNQNLVALILACTARSQNDATELKYLKAMGISAFRH
jgi:hypothetical protein